jgi:flavodoxin
MLRTSGILWGLVGGAAAHQTPPFDQLRKSLNIRLFRHHWFGFNRCRGVLMQKAVILFNSRTGTTGKYAREIGKYIESKGIEVQVSYIQGYKYQPEILENVDYLFLGCWTSGLMVVFQHPEAVWKEIAATLPSKPDAKLALFTTYKILTGSMFRNMAKVLKGRFAKPSLELKSRDGLLSQADKLALDDFLAK